MAEVTKSQYPLDDISRLPEKYGSVPIFFENTGYFIPEKLRDKIFALETKSKSNPNNDILLCYHQAEGGATPENKEIEGVMKRILSNHMAQTKLQRKIEVVQISSITVKDAIIKELKNRDNAEKQRASTNSDNNDTKKQSEFAESFLEEAMRLKASDLHIETLGSSNKAVVRLRIHKELIDLKTITIEEAQSLGQTFYATFPRAIEEDQEKGSGSGIYKHENLLDGEFSRVLEKSGKSMKARLVNIGLNHNGQFNLVLRLIDRSVPQVAVPYSKKGFTPEACEMLKTLHTASRGMVLVIGITGSGKSSTIQNMIQQERDRCGNSRKIYLLEQPIEQTISRVTQINSDDSHDSGEVKNSEQDYSFSNLNRMLMRGDPDSIGYGEIRDNLTAKSAVQGGESGHLVYGTMHVDSAMGVFSRFETFGISLEKICRNDFLKLVMFQHLIPTTCPHCSIPYDGENIPMQFGEFHALKSFKTEDGRPLDMMNIISHKSKLKEGESLIRSLQRKNFFKSKDAMKMKRHIEAMNESSDTIGFKQRLDALIRSSTLPKEKINIRFKGDGCPKCQEQGTNGVVPACEILIPDETFLGFIQSRRWGRAEAHWKSKLLGRRAVQDTYARILSGMLDPRVVEKELAQLGS
ncbi:MAG: hypothetical protein CMI54_07120 [Parcubacteria group bacterium]|nr:hypothetical protein [Parcubacteria group bacterium]|tara:strand:- start:2313 stop:4220 length:1908 start_codon:yes stop_codon:yes gene_type:complete